MRPIGIFAALGLAVPAMAASSAALAGTRVEVWELPKGEAKPAERTSWRPASANSAPAGGAALENRSILVVAQPGQPGAALYFKGEAVNRRAELSLVAPGAQSASPIGKVEVVKAEAGEGVLRLSCDGADAELVLGAGGVCVTVRPGKGAGGVEVRSAARYAVLPDFFADDAVFDPARFAAPKLAVPAENLLLQMAGDGDAIVMCIWPGNLKLPAAKEPVGGERPAVGGKGESPPTTSTPPPTARSTSLTALSEQNESKGYRPPPTVDKEGPEPEVDLVLSGEGKDRRISAARIEFQGKPVHVGVLEGKGLWRDEDVSGWSGNKSTAIAWKRPFEGRWRGDYLMAEGKTMKDWPTRQQSFDFRQTKDQKWGAYGSTEDSPTVWQESLAAFMPYPSVFKGPETRLVLYVDKAERGKKGAAEFPNVYERVLIYPLDRVAATPVTVFTPVDLMRETLGEGPCEYVLDVAGIKARGAGGERQLLATATCSLWDRFVFPLTGKIDKLKQPDGGYKPLDAKDRAQLVQALEDMGCFVRAVHDRLREYKTWGQEAAEFCKAEGAKSAKVKPLADKLLVHLNRLNGDVGRLKFEGPGTEGFWKGRLEEIGKQVKEDKYGEVNSVGNIRDLGNYQDEMVSRCRQYVKGARQEAVLADASDPEVRKFAAELRDRCHRMLRNMHPKECL